MKELNRYYTALPILLYEFTEKQRIKVVTGCPKKFLKILKKTTVMVFFFGKVVIKSYL